MRDLTPGERIGFDAPFAEIVLSGPRLDELGERLGAVIVAFDPNRKIPASFEPITLEKRELRPGASFGERSALRIDFAALPVDVDRLMYVLYIVGGYGTGVTFRDFGSLTATIGDVRFALDFTDRGEAAVILVEMYRYKGAWRLSANGQGFVGGVGAVASSFNVTITVPEPPRQYAGRDTGNDRDRERSGPSSGSGFAIDQTHIVTNAHVVDGARSISVMSEKFTATAEIVFSDPRNDIALLRVDRNLSAAARFRDVNTIDLGEDIVVLGFPLQGLLGSGPTATAGNVSSLCGIGNDSTILQFTAPIASGNSGGPILDASGLIIGLVHASLNLDHVRERGANAENVNFGVKAPIVKTFLTTTGIDFTAAKGGPTRNRADIVREARSYIFRIRCEG
jgi:S1-C subfamily serine protease